MEEEKVDAKPALELPRCPKCLTTVLSRGIIVLPDSIRIVGITYRVGVCVGCPQAFLFTFLELAYASEIIEKCKE